MCRRSPPIYLSALLAAACTASSLPSRSTNEGDPPGRLAPRPRLTLQGHAVTDLPRDPGPPPPSPSSTDDGPPYPVVLAHGFFGFESFAGADFASYFYRVRERLAEEGETAVFTPAVDPFNDSAHRGAQLLAHVEAIVRASGRGKVILLAHSQGGLDARYVASVRPDLVAAVITISTPHRGTPVAEDVLWAVDRRLLRPIVDAVGQIFGRPLYEAAGVDTSLVAALRQLSPEGARRFAERYPDAEEVRYYSLAGRSDRSEGGDACRADGPTPAFVRRWEAERDPIDPLFALTEALLDDDETEPNDGMVRVRDARHGRFLGCIPADHMDEVGHLFGDRPGGGNRFDHLAFYVDLVRWLRNHGL